MSEKLVTLEDIEQADDRELQPHAVPEWGLTVHLRALPADVGLELSKEMDGLADDKKTDALFILLGATLCDAAGNQIAAEPAQRDRLKKKSTKVLLRLQRAALVLQGWRAEGDAAPKA